jgi:hypothetical protein
MIHVNHAAAARLTCRKAKDREADQIWPVGAVAALFETIGGERP